MIGTGISGHVASGTPGSRDERPVQPGLISVIIPTFRRYDDLRRAAQSSVAQTHPQVEVIVVADGPDPLAQEAIAGLGPRLRYYELPHNAGPAAARNFGVEHSRGEWLAFLDDDDLMAPERLALQYSRLDRHQPNRISACRVVYRHGNREDVWPARPLAPGEDLGDYLLIRPSLLGRPGILSLQSLVMHHSVVRDTPMTDHADHEDWAWLLDVFHHRHAQIEFVWEPLLTYNIATESATRSRRTNWQDSLNWAVQYRPLLTQNAFNAFLSSKVALKARRARSWRGLWQVYCLLRHNHPRLLDLLYFFGICLVPPAIAHRAWKRSLRSGASAEQNAVATPPTPFVPASGKPLNPAGTP